MLQAKPSSVGALAQLGSFLFASVWAPHKEVFKGNALLACGKQRVTLQAGNFAALYVANLDRDDFVFRLARWAAEGDRL